MKTEKRKKGDWGEEIACRILLKQGYIIIDRNFSCKIGELDIIAIQGQTISFIEVKTRNTTDFGLPCEAVSDHKKRNILMTAQYYMKLNYWSTELQPRFDIFEILTLSTGNYYRHLINAF